MASAAGPHSYSFWAKKGTFSTLARGATCWANAGSRKRATCGVAQAVSRAQTRTPAKAGAHRKRCDKVIESFG